MDIEEQDSMVLFKESLQIYFGCYILEFQALIDTHEDSVGQTVNENVILILIDPPYNIRFDQDRPHSESDRFDDEDMKAFVELCDAQLTKERHEDMF